MNIISRLLLFIKKGDKSLFDVSVETQRAFLVKLGNPRDDIDRSYKQYQCQNIFVPIWKRIALNFFSIILLPIQLIIYLFNGLKQVEIEKVEAVAAFREVKEVIPDLLFEKFRIKSDCVFDNFSLKGKDLYYIGSIFVRHFIHPYFVLKSITNIAKYSSLIDKYHPQIVIVHAEFSFSSSLLTDYCHSRKVKHFNVMHGEKLFYIRDSFFHYDECYVWDKYYKDLFISLRAEPSQFRVCVPRSLVIDCELYKDDALFADYKYYLAKCSENELRSIVSSMEFVRKNGKTVKYRPHPRWTDITLLERLVPNTEIEYPADVNIMQSVANISYAVGSYSTVLTQAFYSGKKVILDDVTYQTQYYQLKDYKYVLSNAHLKKLSECQ